jgi:hypothetical protein
MIRHSHRDAPDVLDSDSVGGKEALDLAAPGLVLIKHTEAGVRRGLLGPSKVNGEVHVVVVEDQVHCYDKKRRRNPARDSHIFASSAG